VSASDDVVTVQLIGARKLIRSVSSDKMAVLVDLSSLPVGENSVEILPSDVSLPPGVSLNRVTPSGIEVTLDRTITKELPVQIDWTGKLPDELLMTEAEVQPSVVKVSGRSLILKETSILYTDKITINDIQTSGRKTVSILFPETIKPSTGQSDRVTVIYKITKKVAATSSEN
jgi:YbbR domain-containing protein